MLQIHNNLTKKKEPFQPIDPNNVRMYVCGMTVYDMCHLGHARVLIVFDIVYRYLKEIFGEGKVTYIRNITDIDDKIIKRANENGEEFGALTSRFIAEMHKDADALGVQRPDQEPCATMHMQQIIDMIQTLVEKGFAYPASNGDVYYSVSKFEGYGKLSGKDIEDLRAGERVEVDESKNDPMDFVLWKAAKPDEPHWDSLWGKGRPGWHIECSAMSTHCLGHHFDIHGGGLDLQFPHHENEIAQSEAATGKKFVNVWMHNGFVRIDNEKMSKSLGNFFTVREILEKYKPEVVRYFILTSHYRSPLNYSDVHLDNAKQALESYYTALRGVEVLDSKDDNEFVARFRTAMDDDFNTSEALAVLSDVRHVINKAKSTSDNDVASQHAGILIRLGQLLGILQDDPEAYLTSGDNSGSLSNDEIENLIKQRNEARANKDWAESDRVRDVLQADGVILEDGAGGTTWRRL
ncbi:MAG: cysteine--tRNA ligase [Gammaproteobacteria bacterium]|nr:cysteine--tRNA ligase [Gammaproteobacteria bacterium]MDH5594137.1 cysteine--tRNA ligase [Gammaproteobacteria bacterium]MDH5613508.1 cysteine--tRNA ligase [Gammaproteobacteria bacterium]